jgi:predicted lysophospholipase L1 biosynthesis ABC-type transport system permease subunit
LATNWRWLWKDAGPLSASRLTSGRALTAADANSNQALADSGYATQNRLSVGSVIDVGGTHFTITGIVSAPQGGSPPDVYIPLAKAQSIAKNGPAA